MSTAPMAREYKVAATSKIDEALWKRVKKMAIDRGCTVSELVEEALEEKVAREQEGGER